MTPLPKALIFDVFGTVVDWRTGIASAFSSAIRGKGIDFDPHHFADLWRAEYQPAMQRIRAGQRGYAPLEILHRENLDNVLKSSGLSDNFDHAERAELNSAWERLPPWPDVVSGLSSLKQHVTIAPCSNGSVAMMSCLAHSAGLPWDTFLGADIAQNYKPEPEVYTISCKALGLLSDEVMMVAAHNDDLVAARQAGLRCAFVARPNEHGKDQKTDLKPSENWEFTVNTFVELADVFET